nr:hypothetical protein [Tanacetum cinerariifolium]
MTANKIDVVESACEEYSQEVLGFSKVTDSGMSTLQNDRIVSITSPTLTPFGDSDFLLFEEADAFLGLEDDPDSPEPSPPPPNQEQNLPSFKEELKAYEAQTVKSSLMNLQRLDLRTCLTISSMRFLRATTSCPSLLLNNWEGFNPKFCTHKILMEEDYKPTVQHQRRVNPKIHDVIKKEVEKLLDVGLIYPIFDSPWVSPMLERLAGNEYYCFLDGFFGYFQIPIDPRDQEKTTFTCPYGTFAYRRMPFGLCNAPGTFERYKMLQRCEDTNLSLNWEKSHFMVKEGIVLGHKISKNRIEVDKAKIDVIAKLPHPTTVKAPILIAPNWDLPFELMCDASDFAIGAVLGQRHEKHFKPIHYASKTMNDAETNYTTTKKEMLAVVYAKRYLRAE